MMFRNTQEEEESASDWDDLTPNTTPQHQPKSPQPQKLSPHCVASSPTNPFSAQNIDLPPAAVPEQSERVHESGSSKHQEFKPTDPDGVEFVSLADQDIVLNPQPNTPPIIHPAYTAVTTNTPPLQSTSPASRELLPPSHSISDRPLETPPTLSPQDALQTEGNSLPPRSGQFSFEGVTNTLQLHVEKEKEAKYLVMSRYADRSEKIFRRVFQEFFSLFRLLTDIVITFILECAHCLAFHVLRKLCCGLLFIFLSAMTAPGLTECYNIIVWPVAVCCLQVCRAGQMVFTPCVECLGWGAGRCVQIVSACRPVQIFSDKFNAYPRHHQISHAAATKQHV